ncbi:MULTISPECIES: hypothetical protein [Flavobacteriaceae]|uniref:hypothetical protein n=1 Tax=Flavobacteriaceae TaxID=49546 RepID=UPI0014926F19|nr:MULTISPECIES: hypothetical protein [Allomuricauda]MDC6365254.1 hypothetical protein [Muricauda sp. AC10]
MDELPGMWFERTIVKEKDYEEINGYGINKKGGIASTFFAPNLTMNLTYLCYGNTKVTLRAT